MKWQRLRVGRRGMTLLETLSVMSIIALLASLTVGVQQEVQYRMHKTVARSELSLLATALERYKLAYGDYPRLGKAQKDGQGGNETQLFKALTGYLAMERGANGKILIQEREPLVDKAYSPTFLSGSEVGVDERSAPTYFKDPWGNPYAYSYMESGAPSNAWPYPRFILLSAGPDGKMDLSAILNGGASKIEGDDGANADNISIPL